MPQKTPRAPKRAARAAAEHPYLPLARAVLALERLKPDAATPWNPEIRKHLLAAHAQAALALWAACQATGNTVEAAGHLYDALLASVRSAEREQLRAEKQRAASADAALAPASPPSSCAPRSLAEQLEGLERQLHMVRTEATALAASAEILEPRARWFCVSATLGTWLCELASWEEVLADKATALRNASCQEVRHE